jgi:hypothetical protein
MKLLAEQELCDSPRNGIDAETAEALRAFGGDGTVWDYSTVTQEDLEAGVWHCTLTSGHEGTHLVYMQTTAEDEEWWLRWVDGGTASLVTEPPCESMFPDDEDEGALVCGLPVRHSDPHTDDKSYWVD